MGKDGPSKRAARKTPQGSQGPWTFTKRIRKIPDRNGQGLFFF